MNSLLIIGGCPHNIQNISFVMHELYMIYYIMPDATTIENIIKYQPSVILIDTSYINGSSVNFYCTLINHITKCDGTKFIPILLINFDMVKDEDMVKYIKAGALDYIDNNCINDIVLSKIDNHIHRYMDMLILQESVYIDHLTNLYNRRYYEFIIINEWNRTQRDKSSLTMLLIDVDFFKKYNDTYGHLAGDDCLKLVASSLQCSLYRTYDAAIRMGGEEFGIILPNTTQAESWIIASRIKENIISLQIPHENNVLHDSIVTVSIGGVTYNSNIKNIKDSSELYKQADVALYKAKEMGRNRIHIYEFSK